MRTPQTRHPAWATWAAATLAAGMGLTMTAGTSIANAADTTTATSITINASDPSIGGNGTLAGRKLTAYKLAEYTDGTYLSVGDEILDGVDVTTPEELRKVLDPVLAKTAGVDDVSKLPGWDYDPNDSTKPAASKDPIAWMGGFRQNAGDNQADGTFGYGWNESGPQGNGNNSPDKAYRGSVREFAANLVKDTDAMAEVKKQPHSPTVTVPADNTPSSIQLDVPDSGVYLVIDEGDPTQTHLDYDYDKNSCTADTIASKDAWADPSQPMIVPTKAITADMAPANKVPQGKDNDPDTLGTVGKLGEITIKNTSDSDLHGCNPPKKRDESATPGKDAADNGVDVGDTIPYMVSYTVPDLSDYKAAYDNADPWIYEYRVLDDTQHGLAIQDGTLSVDLYAPGTSLYDRDGKVLAKEQVTGKDGNHADPAATISLTKVDQIPTLAKDGEGNKDGQPGQPDAWYYLKTDDADRTTMVIGLGRWLVKNYGNLKLNDKSTITGNGDLGTKLLYQSILAIRYTALVTPHVLDGTGLNEGEIRNHTANGNRLQVSDRPHNVNSGHVHETPLVSLHEWTYDIDMVKRDSVSDKPLEGAGFTVTYKTPGHVFVNGTDEGPSTDWKPIMGSLLNTTTPPWDGHTPLGEDKVGKVLQFVKVDDEEGGWRLAGPNDDPSKATEQPTTDKDGYLRLRGLDMGQYELRETKAPADHNGVKNPETVTLQATFEDDQSDWTVPNAQSSAKLTISQNNTTLAMLKALTLDRNVSKEGLTVTDTTAEWAGQKNGTYYANDKTSWVDAALTLTNQPVIVMLPNTGVAITPTTIAILGLGLIAVGVTVATTARMRRRHTGTTGSGSASGTGEGR